MVVEAERILMRRMSFFFQPALRRRPKSPISCGISCKMVETAVIRPKPGLKKKEAAMATPSIKL